MSYHLLTLQATHHAFTDDYFDRRQPERARRRALSALAHRRIAERIALAR